MPSVMPTAILFLVALLAGSAAASSAPIRVVVAENVYAEAVERVGAASVSVTTILTSPLADPHDYEPTPSVARMVSDAEIVIYNGLGYDAWVERLLAAVGTKHRQVLNVAALLSRPPGDNPHVWYHPQAMPALTDALVAALSRLDPTGAASYAERGKAYKAELAVIGTRIAAIKATFGGTPVTATESVMGHLSQALALQMRHPTFQRAIMNEAQPAAKDIAAIETDIKGSGVRLLFYNSQVTDALAARLVSLARAASVPIVAVTETKPPGVTYVAWMLGILDAIEAALANSERRTP
jgi:zinc/manganese transport system substrate-binding protein